MLHCMDHLVVETFVALIQILENKVKLKWILIVILLDIWWDLIQYSNIYNIITNLKKKRKRVAEVKSLLRFNESLV